MTTADPKTRTLFRLPDPPEKHPNDMTSFKHLAVNGNAYHLAVHLGNPDTTLVTGERYMALRPSRYNAGSHRPDLLVAFDVDPALYEANNGYIIDEQGKAPDFVLEIASRHTGHIDVGEKRAAYEALEILEYWRFDETGQYHGTRLAGDRLEDGRYKPIDIDALSAEVEQGYSAALNLYLRWQGGELALHDPATGRPIVTLEDERLRADREQTRADREQAGRIQAETRAAAAEARVSEMEEQLSRLRGS